MDRSEVMRLAREAGVHALEGSDALAPFIERFASLVRNQALEEAAREVEREDDSVMAELSVRAIRALKTEKVQEGGR